jgi:hypothetical protein
MSNVPGKTNLIIGMSSGIDFSVAGKLASLEEAILTTQKQYYWCFKLSLEQSIRCPFGLC